MPDFVFCILMALTEYDIATPAQIVAASGYNCFNSHGQRTGRCHTAMQQMIKLGLIGRPWHGVWMITEKGKIALAIEVGKRSRARAKRVPRPRWHGRRTDRMTNYRRFKGFMEIEVADA